jgi:hypothetical protein
MKNIDLKQGKVGRGIFAALRFPLLEMTSRANVGLVDSTVVKTSLGQNLILSLQEKGILV